MNVLITGIHGFVGQNLMPYLKNKGYNVYGLGRHGEYTWEDLYKDQLPKVDAIIHLAGKAHDTKNTTDTDVYFQVNRDLAIKIYDYFQQHKDIKTFIFFSSVKAAADKVIGKRLTEDVARTPKGAYGESKAEAEKEIMKRSECDNSQNTYILRPCMMHGPGNKGNLNLLYKLIHTGIPWPLGAFENHRSFASIENVCFVTSCLLEGHAPNGIYNIADDDPLSTNELIAIICNTLSKKTRIWKFSKNSITTLAKIGDKLHLPLNTERLEKLTENYVVDNTKIKQALHIDKMPISTRQGLIYTIQHFKS